MIDGLTADAARLAQERGGRVRVSGGQRLIGEPRVGDKAARARRAHDVAAPEGVDAENGVGDEEIELIHDVFFSVLMLPRHTYMHRPMKSNAETDCEMGSIE